MIDIQENSRWLNNGVYNKWVGCKRCPIQDTLGLDFTVVNRACDKGDVANCEKLVNQISSFQTPFEEQQS
jgi:hypothetical protein